MITDVFFHLDPEVVIHSQIVQEVHVSEVIYLDELEVTHAWAHGSPALGQGVSTSPVLYHEASTSPVLVGHDQAHYTVALCLLQKYVRDVEKLGALGDLSAGNDLPMDYQVVIDGVKTDPLTLAFLDAAKQVHQEVLGQVH